MTVTTNRLANETSPYLLQHAYNPVDWYAWTDEALNKAKAENKPILLSIGYAACHWCHVMAHESFEDAETAAIMNQLFINIKVDKEERPDLDKVYQTTHYLLTRRSGGWPLTVFLTPDDLTPFYSGTYFPKEARYQLPSFKDLIKAVAEAYHTQRDDIKKQNQELLTFLNQPIHSAAVQLNDEPLHKGLEALKINYDKINGGFGKAPKFPQPMKIEFCLKQKSSMGQDTLKHMARGGIYDQLGGGFFRYSVDERWEIPHFEKMLYDNGQLLYLYALSNPLPVSQETASWVIKHMQAPTGGYYSSLDADSEGQEGKYYLWTKEECQLVLTDTEYKIISHHFGLIHAANIEHKWHFYIAKELAEVANELAIPIEDAKNLLASAKKKLLLTREQRVSPSTDKKILTAWNALMIKGMLLAGKNLNSTAMLDSAENAINYILEKYTKHKKLLAVDTHQDAEKQIPGFLDDYAFLIDALLQSLQIKWNSEHFNICQTLTESMITNFYDETHGGFFFTPYKENHLLYRPKTMMDEATPSGNGIATKVLILLGYLTANERYLQIAEKTLMHAWASLVQYPHEHCTLLIALDLYLHPLTYAIIRGTAEELSSWQEKTPYEFVLAIPNDAAGLPAFIQDKTPRAATCAYICRGTSCLDVITNLETLEKG